DVLERENLSLRSRKSRGGVKPDFSGGVAPRHFHAVEVSDEAVIVLHAQEERVEASRPVKVEGNANVNRGALSKHGGPRVRSHERREARERQRGSSCSQALDLARRERLVPDGEIVNQAPVAPLAVVEASANEEATNGRQVRRVRPLVKEGPILPD